MLPVARCVRARTISRGVAEAPCLITRQPLSLLGDISPETGMITNENHELFGEVVRGRILVFPYGVGSTVGSYTLYRLKKCGNAPVGIVNDRAEPIVATGAILSGIPMVDKPEQELYALVKSGQRLLLDANRGVIWLE